jgi:hypothetical protein
MPGSYVLPAPSCTECGLESAGRCPTCRNSLCVDHFGLHDHEPCATHQARQEDVLACYVCGVPVRPQQWSSAVFAHYIDPCTCRGCHRYICDGDHTRLRQERVVIARDGLRSHRYHMIQRYCPACAPLARVGGLLGLSRLAAVACIAAGAAFFLLQH